MVQLDKTLDDAITPFCFDNDPVYIITNQHAPHRPSRYYVGEPTGPIYTPKRKKFKRR